MKGKIPQGWTQAPLMDFCIKSKRAIVDGPFGSNLKKIHYRQKGILIISSGFVTRGEFKPDRYLYVDENKFQQEIRSRVDGGDIVMAKIGARCGSAAIMPYNHPTGILSGNALKISVDAKYSSIKYVWYYLDWLYRTHKFERLMNIGGQPAISIPELKKVPLLKPPLQEQNRIADILTIWDAAIKKNRKIIDAKCRLKKGLFKYLLTGKLRFPEFLGDKKHNYNFGKIPTDWDIVSLNDIFSPIRRKNNKMCNRVLTASGKRGLINQEDFFDKRIAGKNLRNYYLLEKGEFAYNRSFMNGYPFGAIKRLDKYDEGVLSTLYICFYMKANDCCEDFYAQYFESGLLNRQLRSIAQAGARAHGLLNMTLSDFYRIKIPKPPLNEQRIIANVLNNIDREIDLLYQYLSKIEQQKNGLMQQLLTGKIRLKA